VTVRRREERSVAARVLVGGSLVVLLGATLWVVLAIVAKNGASPASSDAEAPGLGDVTHVNPFDDVVVEDGAWILVVLASAEAGDALAGRVAECRAFVADGHFYEAYPEARGAEVRLRVDLEDAPAPALAARLREAAGTMKLELRTE